MIKLTKSNNEVIYFNPSAIRTVQPHIYMEDNKVHNHSYIECIGGGFYIVQESVHKVVGLLNKANKGGLTGQ